MKILEFYSLAEASSLAFPNWIFDSDDTAFLDTFKAAILKP